LVSVNKAVSQQTHSKPAANPQQTHSKPAANPQQTFVGILYHRNSLSLIILPRFFKEFTLFNVIIFLKSYSY